MELRCSSFTAENSDAVKTVPLPRWIMLLMKGTTP